MKIVTNVYAWINSNIIFATNVSDSFKLISRVSDHVEFPPCLTRISGPKYHTCDVRIAKIAELSLCALGIQRLDKERGISINALEPPTA